MNTPEGFTMCPKCGGTGKENSKQSTPLSKRHSCPRCLGMKIVRKIIPDGQHRLMKVWFDEKE